jgi:hypothetical protein
MNAYAVVRDANVLLGLTTGLLFIYMDRGAVRQFRQGLLSGGEFLGKIARVFYMLTTAYASYVAVAADKPAGPYVVLLLISLLLLTAAALWQSDDSWRDSKRRKGN